MGKVTKKTEPESAEPGKLNDDTLKLHDALSELVRIYQFRDRQRICYYDLSVTQCYAISALIKSGPMSQNALAGHLYLDKSTTSRVVDYLTKHDYIMKQSDPCDGRAVILNVTEKAKAVHQCIDQDLMAEIKNILKAFNPEIRKAAIALFSRLSESAEKRFSGKKILNSG